MSDTPEEKLTTVTTPITTDMLPIGPVWEADGACWKADFCGPGEGREWRWHPLNEKALAKDGPEGKMSDFPPTINLGHSISTGSR